MNTWWTMPSWSATRRASSTSATEQQPESEAPPHSLRVAPTTRSARGARPAGRRRPTSRPLRTWPPGRAPALVSQPGDQARDDGQGVVDLGVGGGRPQREADAAPGGRRGRGPWRPARGSARGRRSSRRPRPRRTPRPRPAGSPAPRPPPRRSGGGAMPGHQVAAVPGLGRRRGTAASSPSASRSRRAPTRVPVATRRSAVTARAAAVATMPATLWVPLRRSRSWPPPRVTGSSGVPPRHHQRAHPLRAPELVGAERHQVGRRGWRRAGRARGGLHGVGVEHRSGRPLAGPAGHRLERLDRADLVVDRHHRHQRRRRGCTASARASRSSRPSAVGRHLAQLGPEPAGGGPAGWSGRRGAPWPRRPAARARRDPGRRSPPPRRSRPGCRPRCRCR